MTNDHETAGSSGGQFTPEPTTRSLDANDSSEPTPPEIDGCRILESLGEGGMGVVYLAEQERPVRRRVAIKVIKLGMDTRRVVARFEAERQALALMTHPNVARVFGGGQTAEGRPYFVMEYVPGVPITEHCDRLKLDVSERLRLFSDVCAAVQHAHQKGIIHRDLKPANMLVALEGGVATPKVIDFGVAKALHQKLTESTVFTEHGQTIGTPEYMSPEQAEFTTQDIDTRSDVYALGVILYELLTGELPFASDDVRSLSLAEFQKMIRERTPTRPSAQVGTHSDQSRTSAERRSATPHALESELRGDLDWIVMKCLEKDPARRYQTPAEIAADIERHRRSEPVLAGPPSQVYRLRKFVRRNRLRVSAAALVTLAMVGATVVSVTFAASESVQRRLAEEAQQRAEFEAENAQTISAFFTNDLLAAVKPSASKGEGLDVPMRDVLDAASERIEEASRVGGRFQDKPLIEASIRLSIGWTYRELTAYDVAERHMSRARDLLLQEFGPDDPRTLQSFLSLGAVYSEQGRYEESVALFEQCLEGRRRVLGEEHPDTLWALNNIAVVRFAQGRHEEADPLLRETLELRKRVLGEDHALTYWSMMTLGNNCRELGLYEEAKALYLASVEGRSRILGEKHRSTIWSRASLARLYVMSRQLDEAERLTLRVIEEKREIFGEDQPDLYWSMVSLAELREAQGDVVAAIELLEVATNRQSELLGEEHPETVESRRRLNLLRAGESTMPEG